MSKRLQVIYEPKGPAREYAPLAVNLALTCPHGCRYCYAPATLRTTAAAFHVATWPRDGVLEKLRHDAELLKARGCTDEILLCFLCDPYAPGLERTTTAALHILAAAGLNATVLTKGGMRARHDFPIMQDAGFRFGTSLSWATDTDRAKWEPFAASVQSRIDALTWAHNAGIKTWLSMEPVIDPAQACALVPLLADVVDEWKIGKWNHAAAAAAIDWQAFRRDIVRELESVGANDYLKRDLLEA
jgi:DNA repair photolyase